MKESTKKMIIWGGLLVAGVIALVLIGLYTGAVDPSEAAVIHDMNVA